MFTGLIEEVGTIKGIKPAGDGIHLEISGTQVLEGTSVGDSISINGACQTVTAIGRQSFTVYASRVTCETTTLGSFRPGFNVNLERAMQAGSRFGGHIVQGHVDGRGNISGIKSESNGMEVSIEAGPELLRYIANKGSVAVDGISLTVVSLKNTGFTLYLIPETLHMTTVNLWKSGDSVNIEVDILAKYVERMMSPGDTGKADNDKMKKKLAEEGYL